MPNYFQTMFMGECVIVEYEMYKDEIDYALVTNHNKNFIQPNYEYDNLDDFFKQLYNKVKEHIDRLI